MVAVMVAETLRRPCLSPARACAAVEAGCLAAAALCRHHPAAAVEVQQHWQQQVLGASLHSSRRLETADHAVLKPAYVADVDGLCNTAKMKT